ncbi:MAG: GGDEF domain-containing protein [Gammaproteobacteria bacterium]
MSVLATRWSPAVRSLAMSLSMSVCRLVLFNRGIAAFNGTCPGLRRDFTACYGVSRKAYFERSGRQGVLSLKGFCRTQHDGLTILPNRAMFIQRLAEQIAAAKPEKQKLTVMFLDLNRFRHINDSWGYTIGDRLLQSVAQRLFACVRDGDVVSHLGGDEFAILLPRVAHAQDAIVAERVLAALRGPHCIGEHVLHVTASLGLATCPDDGEDAEALLKSADLAMRHAKDNALRDCQFYTPRDEQARTQAARGSGWSAQRVGPTGVRALLSADREPADGCSHQRRGALALPEPGTGAAFSRRVHPGRGGVWVDCSDRSMGPERGLPPGPRMEGVRAAANTHGDQCFDLGIAEQGIRLRMCGTCSGRRAWSQLAWSSS